MTDIEIERLRDKSGVKLSRVISGCAVAAASAALVSVGVKAVIRGLADIARLFSSSDKLYSVLSQTRGADIGVAAGVMLVCCLVMGLFVMKYRSASRTVLKMTLWTLLFLVGTFLLTLCCTRVNSVPFGQVVSILIKFSGSLGELL